MDDLCIAIDGQRLVEFNYKGYHRLVIPAAVGYHKETGNKVLRGYQIGGGSSSRRPPFWSLFRLDGMSNVITTGEEFTEVPPGYVLDDSDINIVQQLRPR